MKDLTAVRKALVDTSPHRLTIRCDYLSDSGSTCRKPVGDVFFSNGKLVYVPAAKAIAISVELWRRRMSAETEAEAHRSALSFLQDTPSPTTLDIRQEIERTQERIFNRLVGYFSSPHVFGSAPLLAMRPCIPDERAQLLTERVLLLDELLVQSEWRRNSASVDSSMVQSSLDVSMVWAQFIEPEA